MVVVVVLVTSALVLVSESHAYQLTIGPCPLHIGEPCDTGVIKFYLYQNATHVKILDPFKPRLTPHFNHSAQTKIIIHGYSGNLDYASAALTQAYATHSTHNVISVDWDQLAQLPCYPTAVLNTWQAGQCTAVLIVSLAARGIDPRSLHVLGFSLGAHVASFAANWIFTTMGVKIGRITGLDPALPFFATLNSNWKLDSSDAEFVDIIHTNSGIYGKVEATGHTDFYINGGTFQPACSEHKNPPICSHMLAPIYFAESIGSRQGFRGVRCAGYLQYMLGWCRANATLEDSNAVNGVEGNYSLTAVMGEHCARSTRGTYFVDTAKSPPYASKTKNINLQ